MGLEPGRSKEHLTENGAHRREGSPSDEGATRHDFEWACRLVIRRIPVEIQIVYLVVAADR
ncbi:hypothetical protein M433DRAFT_10028 [Acidomyces richmondensis BFW]|nr:hypothetical protein M433DRAFT_10028 [Acidomyces richmondensis BFW]